MAKFSGNCLFPQNLHSSKLGEILLFYAVLRYLNCISELNKVHFYAWINDHNYACFRCLDNFFRLPNYSYLPNRGSRYNFTKQFFNTLLKMLYHFFMIYCISAQNYQHFQKLIGFCLTLLDKSDFRGVLRNPSDIYDKAFFMK